MTDSNWIDATAREHVPDDDVVGVMVAGREIALYGVGGAVFATDNVCTHGQGQLCDGFLDGYEIECPLHQGRFDVRNGTPTCEPASEPIRSYPVKIESGRVWLVVDAD